jgi:alkyl hydroperoxide reductase subunit AhpC
MATLRLGDIAPDFKVETSMGTIKFHEWFFGVLFSHLLILPRLYY